LALLPVIPPFAQEALLI